MLNTKYRIGKYSAEIESSPSNKNNSQLEMPFIWDDLYWHVVGKDEEYDKNRFAIVRKLFIQLNAKYYYYSKMCEQHKKSLIVEVKCEDGTQVKIKLKKLFYKKCSGYARGKAVKCFNEVNIRKEFENYGDIDSVELLSNGKSEAYVTFTDDKSAAMAYGLMNCENDRKITEREYLCFKKYVVDIANTWHQPCEEANNEILINAELIETAPPAIFNLNEDCLRHIFEYCDVETLINLSQVCKTFNDLLSFGNGSKNIIYRQFTTLRIAIDIFAKDRFGKLMTLGKARKHLRRVGPYITKLVVKKLDEANVERFFEKINQYVGENICDMEIYDIRLSDHLISKLQPIFQRLRTLKIRVFDNGFEIDFQTLCPSLINLKIADVMNIERSCRHWPKLQYISLLSDIILPETFCSFISLNPHLKGVKFFHQNFQQIQAIANTLLNVDKLEINCKYKPIFTSQLNHLCQLSNLTQLTLWNLPGHASLIEILLVLIKFTELRTLKLHVSEDQNNEPSDSTVYELKQQTIAALAHRLSNLEKLLLFNIKLEESTVMDIVRSANHLQIFHIHSVNKDLQWSRLLIKGIVNIRKLQQQEQLLKLFLDKNFNILIPKEDQQYLRVYYHNHGCQHARLKHSKKSITSD